MALKKTMPHFMFVIEGWTHFNDAVRSKNATRGTELMFFILFVFLFVRLTLQPCFLGNYTQRFRDKGTSETVHPMTSLRPTLIHIFIYLFLSTHLFSTDMSVHFHPPLWKHIHDILQSIPQLNLDDLFFFFLTDCMSTESHAHICQTWKQRGSLFWKGCGVNRE